ncbi:MAG: adenine phosphoribosyltransferase, partial [Actinomycetota bacterium]|nr:adenine phosphoribosyltransferase [Actinomycetota bacterium]
MEAETAVAGVDLRAYVRDIHDFPQPGIVFKDLTPLFLDARALVRAIELIAEYAAEREVEVVVAAEARGFILGAAVAARVGAGFIPARKPGKLPLETAAAEYALEYGENALEVHADAIAHGARVLVHDDLLATGGTAKAIADLAEQLGAEVVGLAFVIELEFLKGRERLSDYD